MFCLLQRGVPVVAVPDVGHPAAGGGEGLAGAQRHRLRARPPGGAAAAREDVPPEDPIQKSIRDQGGVRAVRRQGGGEARQGEVSRVESAEWRRVAPSGAVSLARRHLAGGAASTPLLPRELLRAVIAVRVLQKQEGQTHAWKRPKIFAHVRMQSRNGTKSWMSRIQSFLAVARESSAGSPGII